MSQQASTGQLSIADHRRDAAGLLYVYPVVSRRAGGVSLGINLNVNRACNWACVYCQVDGLSRGGPLPIDMDRLGAELRGFLEQVLHGDYLARHVAPEYRRLADLAFSGDGEPTSAPEFPQVVQLVGQVLAEFGLVRRLPVRLITNGSLVHRAYVQRGLRELAGLGGEVWFKLDRADAQGAREVNGSRIAPARVLANLRTCAGLVPTWIQTCWFYRDGVGPDAAAKQAYLALVGQVSGSIRGIHLYGLARPSCQPGAERLGRMEAEALQAWAGEITKKTGVGVSVSP